MNERETRQLSEPPGHEAGPVFLEPWHAEAFSLAVALNRQGAFSWSEWTDLFAATLREVPAESSESVEAAYYRRWLLALEDLSPAKVSRRLQKWRDAKRSGATPICAPRTATRWS